MYTDGARYEPAFDRWLPLADAGEMLSARHWHTAIWTDTEMIIWGGYGGDQNGARYRAPLLQLSIAVYLLCVGIMVVKAQRTFSGSTK